MTQPLRLEQVQTLLEQAIADVQDLLGDINPFSRAYYDGAVSHDGLELMCLYTRVARTIGSPALEETNVVSLFGTAHYTLACDRGVFEVLGQIKRLDVDVVRKMYDDVMRHLTYHQFPQLRRDSLGLTQPF